ncbi:MAG: hypothetical protein WCF44_03110 [Candidatus Methylophosphatis roskildensis]
MSPLCRAIAASEPDGAGPAVVQFGRGEPVWRRGESGAVFRVVCGALRFDSRYADGSLGFGGLALSGDVVGFELLSQSRYGFAASALTPVTLEKVEVHWDCDAIAVSRLLTASQRRTADLLALTRGTAADRVRRLLSMIAVSAGRQRMVVLPTGRDTAEVTGLTVETVSRQISAMRRSGELVRCSRAGWSSAWSFRLCARATVDKIDAGQGRKAA